MDFKREVVVWTSREHRNTQESEFPSQQAAFNITYNIRLEICNNSVNQSLPNQTLFQNRWNITTFSMIWMNQCKLWMSTVEKIKTDFDFRCIRSKLILKWTNGSFFHKILLRALLLYLELQWNIYTEYSLGQMLLRSVPLPIYQRV